MLKVEGFKFEVGDIVVPIVSADIANIPVYLWELTICDIHVENFMYTVIDFENDQWEVSPIMLENDFIIKGDVECLKL